MSDEICGHTKNDGEPCTFPPKYPDGKCGHHSEHNKQQTESRGKQSKLEQNPEIKDLTVEEIRQGATVGEALAEVEEKTGVFVSQSTHRNWLNQGKDETAPQIYKDYRTEVTHARKKGKRYDRDKIKQQAMEEGDLRLWWKIHMEQYGHEYNKENSDSDETAPPFAIPENLIDQWQQQAPTPQ